MFTLRPSSSSSFSLLLPQQRVLQVCRFSFLLLFFFLLLFIHSSSNKEIHHRFCHDITIIIKLKFSEDVINFIFCKFVTKSSQNVDEVFFLKDVTSNHLALNLFFNFFIEGFESVYYKFIRIIGATSHLSFKHLDHVIIVAGTSNLSQHSIELIVHNQTTNIVKSCSQVCFVDNSVLVDVHETEAFFVHFEGGFIKVIGSLSLSLSFAISLTHCCAEFLSNIQ